MAVAGGAEHGGGAPEVRTLRSPAEKRGRRAMDLGCHRLLFAALTVEPWLFSPTPGDVGTLSQGNDASGTAHKLLQMNDYCTQTTGKSLYKSTTVYPF